MWVHICTLFFSPQIIKWAMKEDTGVWVTAWHAESNRRVSDRYRESRLIGNSNAKFVIVVTTLQARLLRCYAVSVGKQLTAI